MSGVNTAQPSSDQTHWNDVYDTKGAQQVSWYQPEPTTSLVLLGILDLAPDQPVIDIGGGASTFVDQLLDRGHTDLTVLDISTEALSLAQQRLDNHADRVHWEHADLRRWQPTRHYALWHDRAVFHFLTHTADRDLYRELAAATITPGGYLILATFAADGPDHCSGLTVAKHGPEQLGDFFSDSFTTLATRREEHTTPAGIIQPFTWLVAQRARQGETR